MIYISHKNTETGKVQSIHEHLMNTANLASAFADCFGAEDSGYMCGILHDIGKYADKFQRRINGSSEKVDHSTAGAIEAYKQKNIPVAFCIAGHHSGLPDGGNVKGSTAEDSTFMGKMNRLPGRDIENYYAFKDEVNISPAKIPSKFIKDPLSAYFFIHMLYSCLVDADYLDTESFMSIQSINRSFTVKFPSLFDKLIRYITPWQNPISNINKKRCNILNSAIDAGNRKMGLYTLTVPTGGGKTISSMAFALKHLIRNNLRRIIYVIPYTSIIEQTQKVFENIFGEENVVAHYSNVDYHTDENSISSDKKYLAAENWDAPIILTTVVQFFESLYANRSSRCRKLHNIARSIIIFDEAQMLPVPYLRPCVSGISQLIKNYNCTAVLCTATQPALNKLFNEMLPDYPPKEICPDVEGMYEYFRRVQYRNKGFLSDDQLVDYLSEEKQVLCIVNNRRQAQSIYLKLTTDGKYHLSTMMYPEHRRRVLNEIREKLKSGEACRVISTSLIEAGVDVDFPVVYRSVAGLDSIIQAGGRCNREGKNLMQDSFVYLFESEYKAPVEIKQNISSAERVIRNYKDIAGIDAIKAYFEFLYYSIKGEKELDSKNIIERINEGSMPFASIASDFKVIESSDYTVFIPHDEGSLLIEILKHNGITRELMRKLGSYSVGVYHQHFTSLYEQGAIELITQNSAVLLNMQLYSKETGLSFDVIEGQAIIK